MIDLTLEQQAHLRVFGLEVSQLGEQETKERLKEMYRAMLIRESRYKERLKQEWGIK